MNIRRVFLIVLDSVGAGEAPDAAHFGDVGANTLRSISTSKYFSIPNLQRLGIGNIDGLSFLGKTDAPQAAVARMQERSMGKDTTIGHWEIAGLISPKPLPTFPNGFPDELLDALKQATDRGVLCNLPYSGTDVIRDFGEEHMRTGDLIVYTSADSVFQIAAHESVIPPEQLYDICRQARELLKGEFAVGRVIARPFNGEAPNFKRTANRRDFSLEPPHPTLLDALVSAGHDCISVGKIYDIFATRQFTSYQLTHSNEEGMALTSQIAKQDFNGLCFVNLVDFDMLYGHRNDLNGYAAALSAFDRWLGEFIPTLREDDVLMITADHGCDPGLLTSTDHTREYTPLLVLGDQIPPKNFGTRTTFADIAATIAHWFHVTLDTAGQSLKFES